MIRSAALNLDSLKILKKHTVHSKNMSFEME
uniref:Uncharacterized protein n=1 Tax=Anguilla anguilla TaxID=7936 RepID=A0A0E9RZV9_ANGAN